MLNINTNLSSLIVQSSLKSSTNGLNQAIERMTTGFKINHAKDNAANFSINTKLGSKLSSYYVAQDNASMGLDMLTTAMDNLDLITSHLSRMRDLAEQAANGTYGGNSLKAIQSEVTARLAECNRILDTAEYNKVKLFQKDKTKVEESNVLTEEEALAEGYTIITSVKELSDLRYSNNLRGKFILMNDIDLSNISWEPICIDKDGLNMAPFKGELNGNGFAIKGLESINLFGKTGYGCVLKNIKLEDCNIDAFNAMKGVAPLVGIAEETTMINCSATGIIDDFGINGVSGLIGLARGCKISNCFSSVNIDGSSAYSNVGGLIEYLDDSVVEDSYYTGTINATAQYVGALVGRVEYNCTLKNLFWNLDKNEQMRAYGYEGGIGSSYTDVRGLTTREIDKLLNAPPELPPTFIPFQVGIDSSSQILFNLEFDLNLLVDISSSESARMMINDIDDYLKQISIKQAEFGSAYNRLESALDTIGVSIDNLVSTQSTIRDADIAEESSAYIRNQILQQASATLLATANQTPNIALQLL